MDNPYPYPPHGYQNPPPIAAPYQPTYQPPPSAYLYPSASFSSPPPYPQPQFSQSPSLDHPPPPYPQPQFNHSPSLDYPPPPYPQPQFNHSPSLDYPPPPCYPPPPPPSAAPPYPRLPPPSIDPLPPNYSYYPNLSSQTDNQPYVFPHSDPYDPNSSSFHHLDSCSYPSSRSNSFSATHHDPSADLSTQQSFSSSSSLYPIDDLLANVLLHDQPLGAPPASASSHHRPGVYDYQYQNSSGRFSQDTPPLTAPPMDSLPFGDSQHLAIVPIGGSSRHGPSLKVLLLHGSLDIWVFEARNLPNMDLFSRTVSDMLGPRITGAISGKMEHMTSITSDPYVTIEVCGAAIGRTYVISNSENPVWRQHFNVPVAHHAAEVVFMVKDSDVVGAQLIGTVSIPAAQIYTGQKVEGTYPILDPNGKQYNPSAILRLSIQYIPIERLSIYHDGVAASYGVPNTYFPLRKGGKVTLYQDAHVPDGCLPDLMLGNGLFYEHGKCWHDIFDAISQARRLIYIVGWSVFHTVRLVRDNYLSSCPILGDLLKSKSQEGVRVLLLVWDDPTSRSILGYRTNGIMGTRDEVTRRFFKNSSVEVLLCPRSAGKRHGFVKKQETETIYTHHQKQVVVDANAGNNKRKIIAFVGGLDLCGGRYDTPEHPLFRTLQTVHNDDFHNPNFANADASGPREPWHDLHSKIDGPAAYDVLKNFEERWLKASKRHGINKLKKSSDDRLLSIERMPEIIGADDPLFINDNDPETWHVQIFRSIDSNSVKGFPKDPREATNKNLVSGKNVLIDMSIHRAYVHAIRSAQRFIYIENQYFLGSSFNWDSNKNLGANNLIPIEIALKIANKIKANERFSAYIVIPMWPEGNPTGLPTQRILFWQKKTMQMMYETIYTALREAGLENSYEPQDYLNFFCLGNREAPSLNNASQNVEGSPQALAKKNRRFMIYVHSKGMIVDDEYVIIGSANINQRSLEGTRDTEIAMGACQPQHTSAARHSSPRGQIFGYRMSLWAEHTGTVEECFTRPESLECMRRIRDLGQMNWRQFLADDVTEMRGHLLKYPVDVDRQGKVNPLPGCETFPDIGGNICGSFSGVQENLTI